MSRRYPGNKAALEDIGVAFAFSDERSRQRRHHRNLWWVWPLVGLLIIVGCFAWTAYMVYLVASWL